jgi:ribonuclease HI
MTEYLLYFDGCSKGNPGPSGAGAVIYKDGEEIFAGSLFVGEKETNNVAEYSGLLLGLEKAREMGIKRLKVKGDSLLVIKQMRGEYQVRAPGLIPLYKKALRLSKEHFQDMEYLHVERKWNERADALSNEGLLNEGLLNEGIQKRDNYNSSLK